MGPTLIMMAAVYVDMLWAAAAAGSSLSVCSTVSYAQLGIKMIGSVSECHLLME